MNKHPITVEGEKALKIELEHLKSQERPRIIQAIAEAREHGDLKENAEYHAAREQQSFCEGRIQELEEKLANIQVIDVKSMQASETIVFGTTVHLLNLENDEEAVYKIVGEDEVDLSKGKISFKSPIASSLIRKSVGDIAAITTPGGVVEYEILEVEYK